MRRYNYVHKKANLSILRLFVCPVGRFTRHTGHMEVNMDKTANIVDNIKIVNPAKQTVLADACKVANTFFSRFRGLIGIKDFPKGSALIIKPCNSIHMFFMKFPIDVVFLDPDNTIVFLLENIKPWRVSPIIRKACCAIELPAGAIRSSGTETGDRLFISPFPFPYQNSRQSAHRP